MSPAHRAGGGRITLNPLVIALLAFGGSCAAAALGMVLHIRLPDDHLDADSRDVVKQVMGLIATIAALVLSLLIASASASYDRQSSELKAASVEIVLLDRTLAFYGPEAKAARHELRDLVQRIHDRTWSLNGARPDALGSAETEGSADAFAKELQGLSPRTGQQAALKSRAIQEGESITQSRLLMFEQQHGGSISWPFLAILMFWIGVLFLGFGLFARFNWTVTVALLVGALSVAAAIFLILELNEPYRGLVRLSDQPWRHVLTMIDR